MNKKETQELEYNQYLADFLPTKEQPKPYSAKVFEEIRQKSLYKHNEDFPPCEHCIHLTHMGNSDFTDWQCKEFEDEIPISILERDYRHTKATDSATDSFYYESEIVDGGDGDEKITFSGEWVSPEDYEQAMAKEDKEFNDKVIEARKKQAEKQGVSYEELWG